MGVHEEHGPRSTAWRRELLADLRALAPHPAPGTPAAWVTTPAVCRRLARALAEALPAGRHRLLALEPGDALLAGAVSLTSGLDLVVAAAPGSPSGVGALRPGDDALLVTAVAGPAHVRTAADLAAAAGARLAAVVCVATSGAAADDHDAAAHPAGPDDPAVPVLLAFPDLQESPR